ncbi:proton-coupled amino acid transporter-like protein acs [Hetaerina americana]|uniref:proton-coupled amino acid transporter-like protein acs n=1 Tax=Hetaerina americana TaxID=62018 RepID=UPI003A7F1C4E
MDHPIKDNETETAKSAEFNGDTAVDNKRDIYVIGMHKDKDFLVEYEPYDHRQVEKPTSNFETLFHLLKGSLGSGILAMHNAFMHSGYVVGVVGVLVIAFIYTHCMHILVSSVYELCRRHRKPSLNYPTTAQLAFAAGPPPAKAASKYAGHVLNWLQVIYQAGTLCVYIVFIAKNLQEVVDAHVKNSVSLSVYMVAVVVPLTLILVFIRNLKALAPFSVAGNLITFIGFGIILYYIAAPDEGSDAWGLPPISTRNAVGTLDDMPLFFGMVLFALDAIGVVMPLENNMKTPRNFGGYFGVLNQAMSFIAVLYSAIAFCGYMKYGPNSKGSITLNLPQKEGLAQSVKVLLSAAMCVTFAVQAYVAVDILWNFYLKPRLAHSRHLRLWESLVRTAIVLVCFILAAAIPNLELFISLFGAFCLSSVGLIYPALVQTFTFWYIPGTMSRDHPKNWEGQTAKRSLMLFKNFLLIVFAFFGLVIGSYTSLKDIVDKYN